MQPATMHGVIAAVINFNTAVLTAKCIHSLLEAGVGRILVLDNASAGDDYESLGAAPEAAHARVQIVRSETNLGFAEGSNFLIEEALRHPTCDRVLLVNSDAVVEPGGLDACLVDMTAHGYQLMGGRMLKPAAAGSAVDSLGIALYKSLLASNRKSTDEAYLGPTGGFAIYSRGFLEEVKSAHGYVFDPTYFCYAEDTDLCVRARLLGASAGYTDRVVGYHEGQASNAGGYNDFILYHGIRNSIWMAAKSIPGAVILRYLPWFLALHAGIVLRHLRQGRWKTLWRLYRDAVAGLPRVLAERRTIQASRRITAREFRSHVDRRFYESSFLKAAVRDLFPRT